MYPVSTRQRERRISRLDAHSGMSLLLAVVHEYSVVILVMYLAVLILLKIKRVKLLTDMLRACLNARPPRPVILISISYIFLL